MRRRAITTIAVPVTIPLSLLSSTPLVSLLSLPLPLFVLSSLLFAYAFTLCASLFLNLFPPGSFFFLLLPFNLTLFPKFFGLDALLFFFQFFLLALLLEVNCLAFISFRFDESPVLLVRLIARILFPSSHFVTNVLATDLSNRTENRI